MRSTFLHLTVHPLAAYAPNLASDLAALEHDGVAGLNRLSFLLPCHVSGTKTSAPGTFPGTDSVTEHSTWMTMADADAPSTCITTTRMPTNISLWIPTAASTIASPVAGHHADRSRSPVVRAKNAVRRAAFFLFVRYTSPPIATDLFTIHPVKTFAPAMAHNLQRGRYLAPVVFVATPLVFLSATGKPTEHPIQGPSTYHSAPADTTLGQTHCLIPSPQYELNEACASPADLFLA
ncbi:hypothetical protein E4U54_000956 [Claviceps lovelessii]|nr:hypothetical protein E4U54_000956 [Claviceps lovelessii]